MKYFMLALLLSGCSVSAGVAIRGDGNDYLNRLENPLGVVRLEHQFSDKLTGSCTHVSSIPDNYDRPGTNFCAGEVKLW